jgi:hypothetical protein
MKLLGYWASQEQYSMHDLLFCKRSRSGQEKPNTRINQSKSLDLIRL